MYTHKLNTIGTVFEFTIWDENANDTSHVMSDIEVLCRDFEQKYSRFRSDSLVASLKNKTGVYDVDEDFMKMLSQYVDIYEASHGFITPCIGQALENIGYDATYSMEQKAQTAVPELTKAVRIISPTQIEIVEPVSFDFGAIGKGFLIDKIFDFLKGKGYQRFLVNGSGDIRYYSHDKTPINCGLEHPYDTTKVIGSLSVSAGALCASSTERRRIDDKRHHYIDPHTGESVSDILATWVTADAATDADLIASALFFVDPSELAAAGYVFEYLIVNNEMQIKKSAHFGADLF